jgi:REP element-mobilizing transposase RayT
MARVRKVHIQLELPEPKKLDKNGQHRGGKRKGAGRKPKDGRDREKHDKRPPLDARHPVHVTLRVAPDLRNLRKRHIYDAVRFAMASVFEHEGFHIIHLSIQRDHLHLIVEARNRRALSTGMRVFENVVARFINDAITRRTGKKRSGQVVPDRYHEGVIRTPTQARNALRYVMNNWRKHGEHRQDFARGWLVDPYSSAIQFPGWSELDGSPWMWRPRAGYNPLPVWRAKTWVLDTGWTLSGAISAHDVPGRARSRRNRSRLGGRTRVGRVRGSRVRRVDHERHDPIAARSDTEPIGRFAAVAQSTSRARRGRQRRRARARARAAR